MLNDRYGPSWIAFRELSGENSVLVDCISPVIESFRLPRGFTLIDVGSGDGTLTCQLIAEKRFDPCPGLVYFLEPLTFLRQKADKWATTELGPQKIVKKVSEVPLSSFPLSPHAD